MLTVPAVLLLCFVLIPTLEIYVISRVGHLLGLPLTLGVLLMVSVVGAALVKREGLRAWQALRAAVTAGQLPTRHLADAALVLVGGVLLLTPGFVTDAAGLLLVLPATRAVARRLLTAFFLRRALGTRTRRARRRSGERPPARIIEGQVIERPARPD